jgi:hypothetical protein
MANDREQEQVRQAVEHAFLAVASSSLRAMGKWKITADSLSLGSRSDRSLRRGSRGVSAWIIQWVPKEVAEQPLELAAPRSRRHVVSVLSSRLSDDRVCEIAKAIYIAQRADPSGVLALYRLERNRSRGPGYSPVTPVYPVLEMQMGDRAMRAPFTGRFRFGRDPCLYARRVKNLRESASGTLEWDELPIPADLRSPGSPGR